MSDPYICDECGQQRIKTTTGYVCPDGHGRLHIALTPTGEKRRAFLAWREKLPEAVRASGVSGRVAFRIGSASELFVCLDFDKPCTPDTIGWADGVIAKVRRGNGWLVRGFVPVKKRGE